METSIRVGKIPFYATDVFPHGISRSSYFNKRESEELILFGHTFSGLQNGFLTPTNEEEVLFVSEINSSTESTLYAVRLWKKYLHVLEVRGIFHGFSMSNRYVQPRRDSTLEYAS